MMEAAKEEYAKHLKLLLALGSELKGGAK